MHKNRNRISLRVLLALVVLTSAFAVLVPAQESEEFNFQVIDGNDWLIETFDEVHIYLIDPETDERVIDVLPAAVILDPRDPIELQLDPGFYEFVVWMRYFQEEFFYFRFEIIESKLRLIDLRSLELPEELMTY